MIALSIIIPCYNEADNLAELITQCRILTSFYPDVEVILVNNGSTDSSQEILEVLVNNAGNTSVRSLLIHHNKGYGNGILAGLKEGSGKVLCWSHADLQTDIADCISAYEIYVKYNSPLIFVKGRRQGRGLFDRMFTSLMSAYVFIRLCSYIPDINAQPKLFSRELFNRFCNDAPDDFSLDLYMLIHAKRAGTIVEFPVTFKKRTGGEAKGGGGNLRLKFRLTARTLRFINQFKA